MLHFKEFLTEESFSDYYVKYAGFVGRLPIYLNPDKEDARSIEGFYKDSRQKFLAGTAKGFIHNLTDLYVWPSVVFHEMVFKLLKDDVDSTLAASYWTKQMEKVFAVDISFPHRRMFPSGNILDFYKKDIKQKNIEIIQNSEFYKKNNHLKLELSE